MYCVYSSYCMCESHLVFVGWRLLTLISDDDKVPPLVVQTLQDEGGQHPLVVVPVGMH